MGDNGFYNYLRANFVPDITFEAACELRRNFFAGYPDMARWQDEYARQTREQGYTQTVAGRRWRWKWQAQDPEDIDEDAPFYADIISGFSGAYAVNHPVQGSSAEVMQIALPGSIKRFATNRSRYCNRARRSGDVGSRGHCFRGTDRRHRSARNELPS